MAKKKARCFGQDLMRHENPNFGGGNTTNLTWVKGHKKDLDDTSRKILAASPKRHSALTQKRLDAEKASNINNAPSLPPWAVGNTVANMAPGTSIFDPVLCELVYRWFCPKGGKILDPFAGGSVRGVVAGYLGYDYTGIELRPEQVEANRQQAEICKDKKPIWIVGDSANADTLATGEYDLIFSCPPYYDLEVYSESPGELSAIPAYDAFIQAYRLIISKCVTMLKPNRFACFVVGDIRDKKGFYRNFVSDTITAFQEAGGILYNDAILITAVGSLPIRVARAFQSNRKLGKTHQNVLIFYKGDISKIREFGEVEVGEIEQEENQN